MTDYDKAGHGRVLGGSRPEWGDLEGPGRPYIGCLQDRGEPGQAQANAKDKNAPGVCGILRHQMFGLVRSCPYLPRPIRTQNGPALFCLGLHCLTLPFPPPLSSNADHARPC